MNRPRTLLVLAVLLAGCRTPPQGDPFLLGRSTIPPPGTGAIGQSSGQASLAPPARATIPQQTAVPSAPPTMNAVPITPAPPSMNAPPVTNPYNFRQGSVKSSSAEEMAGNWTPTRQATATTNQDDDSNVPATTVTAAKTNATAPNDVADSAAEEEAAPTKSEVKVTTLEASTDRVSSKSASTKSLPEPARFTPQGNVIRIVEPEAKGDGDSAALERPTSAMTASSFQPQWQRWTGGSAE